MEFYAAGKLMFFGEYLVLKGAPCLAAPLNVGQSLIVNDSVNENLIHWESFELGHSWLNIIFDDQLNIKETNSHPKAKIVQKALRFIQEQKPNLPIIGKDFRFDVNFKRAYGFGTSSTFISLLSQWSKIKPYKLMRETMPTSGYDVAAATVDTPFLYSLKNRLISTVTLPDEVSDHILFVYRGKKQSTAKSVKDFKSKIIPEDDLQEMAQIVARAAQAKTPHDWGKAMEESEILLSPILELPKIKDELFSDYPHPIKSMGAWGGDFFMALFENEKTARKYFKQKGFSTAFAYKELVR